MAEENGSVENRLLANDMTLETLAATNLGWRSPVWQDFYRFSYDSEAKQMKVRYEGVDTHKIADQELVDQVTRHRVDKSSPGPIRRTAFFLFYG